jgi:O-antigen ligase
MSEILIFIFAIAYLILAIKKLDWALLLILLLLPAYVVRFSVLGIPSTMLELMILMAFAVWVLTRTKLVDFLRGKYKWSDVKKNRLSRQKYPYRIEMVLVLLSSYGAIAVAHFSNEALGIWKAYFFEPLLVLIMLENLFKGFDGLKKISYALFASALYVSVYAIFQKFTGFGIDNPLWAAEETRRVTSLFAYPNAVGLYLAPLALLAAAFVWSGLVKKAFTKKEFVIPVIVFVMSMLAIYFAKSEGALVGVLAGLTVFGMLASRRLRVVTISAVLLLSLIVAVNKPLRIYTFEKITLEDLSGEIRKQQWRETWKMLKNDRLVFGAGLAGYQQAVSPYHQEGIFFNKEKDPDFQRKIFLFDNKYKAEHWQPVEIYLYPHNIVLNFWTEIGFLGMLVFAALLIKYFYFNFKFLTKTAEENKYLILGMIGAMVAIFVHGLVDVPYFKNDLAVMFWVLIAMSGMIGLEMGDKKEI